MKPYKKVGLFGLLLLPFTIILMMLGPSSEKVPDGYNSAIVAFEFASDEQEVNELFDQLSEKEIEQIDLINYVDFPFMLTYGTLLFLFLSKLATVSGQSFFDKVKWLAPVVVICDVVENLQLLQLTKAHLNEVAYNDQTFQLLAIFTWAKWLLLALLFAIIAVGIIQSKPKLIPKITAMLLLLPIFLGVAAFSTHRPGIEDLFTASIFLSFLGMIAYCFIYKDTSQESPLA